MFYQHQSPESSFTKASTAAEDELQALQSKLSEVEANNRQLNERLHVAEQLLQEKESAHAEQVMSLGIHVDLLHGPAFELCIFCCVISCGCSRL